MARLILRNLEVNRILDLGNVRVEFHPRLTVLTGTNSAGKTMLCGASVLALLGLQGLKSTHWGAKIASDNLARKGTQGGETNLRLDHEKAEYTFTYRHRKASPHEASGPEGPLTPSDALRLLGIDVRAVGFLTTSERRPPWMVVEGDEKTEDVKTILRNSLQTTLAARVDGCKGVRGVVEAEMRTINEGIRNDKNQKEETVNRWLEKAAFAESERSCITEVLVNERLSALSTLRTSLDESQVLVKQSDGLAALQAELDKVKDLPAKIEVRQCLKSLSDELDTRLVSLASLDSSQISRILPSIAIEEGDSLVEQIGQVHEQCKKLLASLEELETLCVNLRSRGELLTAKTRFEDEKSKLESAKTALADPGEMQQVSCKVYRGNRLLVQLEEDFAKNISSEELGRAMVIAPFSEEEEHRVTKIVNLLKDANNTADTLEKAIGTTKTAVDKRFGDIRVLIAQKQTGLGGLLPSIRELNCPADRLPDAETGANMGAIVNWVEERSADVGHQVTTSVRIMKDLLAPVSMIGWRERIEPHLGDQSESKSDSDGVSSAAIEQVIEDLKGAIRSLEENKDSFVRFLNAAQEKEQLHARYQQSILALDTYLSEVQFREETVQLLTEKFLDFVRSAQEVFAFRFKFELDDGGSPELCREDLDGAIHTGGGETQVLGVLMMLAVAAEFGFPVIIDEIGSYLHQDNLRRLLEFIYHQTEVQVILTSADDELLERLAEWGLEHRGYVVTKDSAGFTHVV